MDRETSGSRREVTGMDVWAIPGSRKLTGMPPGHQFGRNIRFTGITRSLG
jgi:hypothetical protein